jgi:hypothetical protein
MYVDGLFEKVLMEPFRQGADSLRIISGYASSAMAFKHLDQLSEIRGDFSVSLLVGMSPYDGITVVNHNGFNSIVKGEYKERFDCSYVYKQPPVHSKIYTWYRKGEEFKTFIGSANYTQNAFGSQREAVADIGVSGMNDYWSNLIRDSIPCTDTKVSDLIGIYQQRFKVRKPKTEAIAAEARAEQLFPNLATMARAEVSLLSTRTGQVQTRGGLNWGQREGRNPNQAYIQLSPEVYQSAFFPLRSIFFTVITDDQQTFICTRAQKSEEGQVIETPHDNSILGRYFRQRLGLPDGAYVETEDLVRYGRTGVTFYKIDDENFYMDFSI